MAPAEVPDMASIVSHDSSSSRSRTPHVKAPCEPPPCSARSISCEGRSLPAGDGSMDIARGTPSPQALAQPVGRSLDRDLARGEPADVANWKKRLPLPP